MVFADMVKAVRWNGLGAVPLRQSSKNLRGFTVARWRLVATASLLCCFISDMLSFLCQVSCVI